MIKGYIKHGNHASIQRKWKEKVNLHAVVLVWFVFFSTAPTVPIKYCSGLQNIDLAEKAFTPCLPFPFPVHGNEKSLEIIFQKETGRAIMTMMKWSSSQYWPVCVLDIDINRLNYGNGGSHSIDGQNIQDAPGSYQVPQENKITKWKCMYIWVWILNQTI